MTGPVATVVSFLILLLEAAGIAVIIGGFVIATIILVLNYRRLDVHAAYLGYRRRSVRSLILGLDFLVAADIIKTVMVDYSLDSVIILGIIILIRSFLVFALHIEIEGQLPWRRSPEGTRDDRFD